MSKKDLDKMRAFLDAKKDKLKNKQDFGHNQSGKSLKHQTVNNNMKKQGSNNKV